MAKVVVVEDNDVDEKEAPVPVTWYNSYHLLK